jgi:hypothetical protein
MFAHGQTAMMMACATFDFWSESRGGKIIWRWWVDDAICHQAVTILTATAWSLGKVLDGSQAEICHAHAWSEDYEKTGLFFVDLCCEVSSCAFVVVSVMDGNVGRCGCK